MSDQSTKRENGFSLLEMLIAMALGTMVVGAAVLLYSQAVRATWTVSQPAAPPTSAPTPTDAITAVYADNSFYLNCYQATVTAKGKVTFGPSTIPDPKTGALPAFPPAGCLPNLVNAPQAVNDNLLGLTPGDLILMNLNGTPVVGEVTAGAITTGTNAVGTTYIVPFANNDPLKMNQTAADRKSTRPKSPH